MLTLAKKFAYSLPPSAQERMKTAWYGYRRHRGDFHSREPEFERLADWIRPGDTVLDIGANIGMYTLRMAELAGRVIAFEPVPQTFRLLAKHTAALSNVTLLNVAASSETGTANIAVPVHNGWLHPTRASIAETGTPIMTVAVDGLGLPKVSFVKIDVEGHEFAALSGMVRLLERDKPVLLVEVDKADDRVPRLLSELGYTESRAEGSPNAVYT